MDYVFVDDSAIALGGTALTLEAIIEPIQDRVEFVKTSDLTLQHLQFKKPKIWILGNITSLTAGAHEALYQLMTDEPFVKIEFDYGYCKFRGEIPHQKLGGDLCDCPSTLDPTATVFSELYNLVKQKALHIFYMSEEQRNFHLCKVLGAENAPRTSVLSSCFLEKDLSKMEFLRQKPKNGKHAIIDGLGGWHTQAKGVNEALDMAQASELDYSLIKTQTHEELLDKLSDFSCLIFLPIIHDTCPRIVIEAKLMGLDVLTNSRSQHVYEDWWHNKSVEETHKYIRERPKWFCSKLKEIYERS
jgi:hypothetical protein